MTKNSPRNIIRVALRILITLILLRSYHTRNSLYDLDLSTQTLNPGVTGFMIKGSASSDQFGQLVSAAGDIDNDGYDDIIIAAKGKNSNRGAIYVIYGGEETSFLDLDLSITTLDPQTTGFTITGNAAGDLFGASMSTAGDIDNDGYNDIIVGAYGKGAQGAAYVIYGGPKSSMSNIDLSTQTLNPSTTGFMITGNGASFGYSVSTAGDVNNDGYDDIIAGAPNKDSSKGVVYVIYGGAKSSMTNIVLSSTPLNPSTTGFTITGYVVNSYFGQAVSTAGDINQDGYSDIIVGAYGTNSVQGVAYVIYGQAKSTMSNIILSSTALSPTSSGFVITGSAAGDALGQSVSSAGDINKDGYDDIIIGAFGKNSYQGAAYVIYGGEKSTLSNWEFSSGTTLNPSMTGFIITGNAVGDQLGFSVRPAGDINKDGYGDIIVGAGQKNGQQGAVYVIYGGLKSSMTDIVLSSTPLNPSTTGFTITGNAVGDFFGSSVSTAGDINNDGYNDIIVGAPFKNSNQGAAYVIYASCSANCKQCSSESVCTQCKNSFLFYKSECFASCPDTTFANTATTCQDCSTHCKHCSSSSVCTECQNSYILYQSKCLDSCPDEMYFSSTTSTCEDCLTSCSKCSSLYVCSECVSPFALFKSQCLTSCPTAMFNSNNVCKDCPPNCYFCTSQDSCQVCYQAYTLSNSLCVLSFTGVQEKASQAIASATQGIGSVLCVGSAIFPFSALVSKIVQNTRYLNLSVTSDLTEVYQSWQTDLISWDVPNIFSNEDNFKSSPHLFTQYDLGSPFLVNFWPTLINIGIGFGTFIACIFLKKVFEHEKYEGWAYLLVLKLVAGSFNFALIQAYACLDDILFYLVLDAKTNPFNSFFSWTSMICAVLFLAFGCLQVFFNFWTVYKYQGIKIQGRKDLIEAFNERNKYWELFYSDFNDNDLYTQSFFAIAIIRSALSSFIITILYDYPLMQASYLIMMDFTIISFLYLKNPFNTLRGKLAQYYYEVITLLVHLCAFILALQDTFEESSETVRLIMSTGILYLNTALISGAIGFMFIEIYKKISEKERAARLKRRHRAHEDPQETQNLTQTVSPFHPSQADLTNQELNKSYLFPENSQKPNLANPDFINMESNFNMENSGELEMFSNSQNHQRNQSTRPIRVETLKKRQQRNSPIFPSYTINNKQFSNN